jgi:hypothetical protein
MKNTVPWKRMWKKSLIGKNSDPLKNLHLLNRKKDTEDSIVEDAYNILNKPILQIIKDLTVL